VAEVSQDDILAGMRTMARVVGNPEAVNLSREADYKAARARIDALIEHRRVEELPDGRLRYHLTTPIELDSTGVKIEHLTFSKPTVGIIRRSSGIDGDERVAFMIKNLSDEIPDDKTLDKIDGCEWDDIAEVCLFPFEHRPPRFTGDDPGASRPDSGEKS